MYLQTPGFILKHRDWREVDRIYTAYTQKSGKLDIGARGVRKIGSKLRGHLQPFALVDLHLVRGKYRYQLIGAELRHNYQLPLTSPSGSKPLVLNERAITNSKKIGYGFYFLELVDKITREEQRNDEVFDLIKQGLEILQRDSLFAKATVDKQGDNGDNLKLLRLAFLLKLLKIKGFNPAKRVVREPKTQAALEYYLDESFENILQKSSKGITKTLFNISQYTLNEVIERPLKTVKFLQSL